STTARTWRAMSSRSLSVSVSNACLSCSSKDMFLDGPLGSAPMRFWHYAGRVGAKSSEVWRDNSSRLNSLTQSREEPYNEDVRSRETSVIGVPAWGRYGFDGGKDSRDACRAPSSRKSGGTQRNCGHAARSRCLIKQRRPPRSRL